MSTNNDPVSGSALVARMRKEMSDVRIGLLEAATDYLIAMTELTEYEEHNTEKRSSEHKPD